MSLHELFSWAWVRVGRGIQEVSSALALQAPLPGDFRLTTPAKAMMDLLTYSDANAHDRMLRGKLDLACPATLRSTKEAGGCIHGTIIRRIRQKSGPDVRDPGVRTVVGPWAVGGWHAILSMAYFPSEGLEAVSAENSSGNRIAGEAFGGPPKRLC